MPHSANSDGPIPTLTLAHEPNNTPAFAVTPMLPASHATRFVRCQWDHRAPHRLCESVLGLGSRRHTALACTFDNNDICGNRMTQPSLPHNLKRDSIQSHSKTSDGINTTTNSTEAMICDTLHQLEQARLILCIRESDRSHAYNAACAAIRGGIRAIEMTLTTPDAYDVMRQLRDDFSNLQIGAGTVMSVEQVDHLAGLASFVMSPVTDVRVIARAHARGILAIPGALSPSEVWHAHAQCGAKLVKVFPVSACGGLGYVKALKGPMPEVKLLPTSSVAADEVRDFLAIDNVLAVGVSRQIVNKDMVAQAEWAGIEENARQWVRLSSSSSQEVSK